MERETSSRCDVRPFFVALLGRIVEPLREFDILEIFLMFCAIIDRTS